MGSVPIFCPYFLARFSLFAGRNYNKLHFESLAHDSLTIACSAMQHGGNPITSLNIQAGQAAKGVEKMPWSILVLATYGVIFLVLAFYGFHRSHLMYLYYK